MISNIVVFTNTYAAICKSHPSFIEKVGGCNRTLLNLWRDVTKDDIWIYMCIIMFMGIINKPHYHMYWSSDPILCTPIFSRLMRRDRFEQIRSMMHFTDPLNEDPQDPLWKLSSFLEEYNPNSSAIIFQTNMLLLMSICLHGKGVWDFANISPANENDMA